MLTVYKQNKMYHNQLLLLCILVLISCKNNTDQKIIQPNDKALIMCSTSVTSDIDWYTSGEKAPLLEGLQGLDFTVTTQSEEAQKYINQGLMLAYGFNHAEAARSFFQAGRADSSCAMAFWGFAYVLGPNYNGGMEDDNYERAYGAILKAKELSSTCSPREKALIEAMATRYSAKVPEDRSDLDLAYAQAMKKVYQQFPSDPDIGAMYAESLMNLHPWDLYDKTSKEAKPWTPEIVDILVNLMNLYPKHPGPHHFYIHAMEASAFPEKALPSAHLLDTLVPGSGHLVHMPSHIYINTGDYHLGSLSNIQAVEVDSIYTATCHAQGAYPLAYYPHNYHFLAATATLEGNSAWAWDAAIQLQNHTAKDLMAQEGWGTLQHYYTIPYYIAVKFGLWDKILNIQAPPENLPYPQAVLNYARGMAFLGKKDLQNAKNELKMLDSLAQDQSLKELTIWEINSTYDLIQIANMMLSAEIKAREGKIDEAVNLLIKAVSVEDNLNYNEPPDWFFSVRHHLGYLQLKSGKNVDAEKTYRKDLETWKKNGWALIGLQKSLEAQKKNKEALIVKAEFDKAWKYADIKINSSSSLSF